MIRLFFLSYFIFFLFLCHFSIGFKGKYQDWLEYQFVNKKLFLKLYVDRMLYSSYYSSQQKIHDQKPAIWSYPTFYRYINNALRGYISGNPIISLYVRFVMKNKIYIYVNFDLKDKDSYEDFSKYITDTNLYAEIYLDKFYNLDKAYFELSGKYISMSGMADKISLQTQIVAKLNYFSHSQVIIKGLSLNAYISSYPCFNATYTVHIHEILHRFENLTIILGNVAISNSNELFGLFFLRGLIKHIQIKTNNTDFIKLHGIKFYTFRSSFEIEVKYLSYVNYLMIDNTRMKFDLFYRQNNFFSLFNFLKIQTYKFFGGITPDNFLSSLNRYFGKYLYKINPNTRVLGIVNLLEYYLRTKEVNDFYIGVNVGKGEVLLFWKTIIVLFSKQRIDYFDGYNFFYTNKIVNQFYEVVYFGFNEFFIFNHQRFTNMLVYSSRLLNVIFKWNQQKICLYFSNNKNKVLLTRTSENFSDLYLVWCSIYDLSQLIDLLKEFLGIDLSRGYNLWGNELKLLSLVKYNQKFIMAKVIWNSILSSAFLNLDSATLNLPNIDSIFSSILKGLKGFIDYRKDKIFFYNGLIVGFFRNLFFYLDSDLDQIYNLYRGFNVSNIRNTNKLLRFIEYLYKYWMGKLNLTLYYNKQNWIWINGENILGCVYKVSFRSLKVSKGLKSPSIDLVVVLNNMLLNVKYFGKISVNTSGCFVWNKFGVNYFITVYDGLIKDLRVNIYKEGKTVAYIYNSLHDTFFLKLDFNELDLYGITNFLRGVKGKIKLCFKNDLLYIYLEDLVFNLDLRLYALEGIRLGLNIEGDIIFDVKSKNISYSNIFVRFQNSEFNDIGTVFILYKSDKMLPKKLYARVFMNHRAFELINLTSWGYVNLKNPDGFTSIELSLADQYLNLDYLVKFDANELFLKSYRVLDLIFQISGRIKCDWSTVLNLRNLDDWSNLYSKTDFEMDFKANYYIKAGDIYKKIIQNLYLHLNHNKFFADGQIQISFTELQKILNLSILSLSNDVDSTIYKTYVDEILSSGTIVLHFDKLQIDEFKDFIYFFKNRSSIQNLSFQRIDFVDKIQVFMYFVLQGYNYSVKITPKFNFRDNSYYLDFIRITVSEIYQKICDIEINYPKITLRQVWIYALPSFISNFRGNITALLSFDDYQFFVKFENLQTELLSNKVEIDGDLILSKNGFVPPFVKINSSPVKIGYNGEIVSIVFDVNEISTISFKYKGRIRGSFVIPLKDIYFGKTFKYIQISGNLQMYKGILNYNPRKLNNPISGYLKLNLNMIFNRVRFKNNIMDIVFGGNIRYYNGYINGELTSTKGFISFIDGIYRVIHANLNFINDPKGELYVLLQKMSSSPFDYRVKIIKGNIKDFNLADFGMKDRLSYGLDDAGLSLQTFSLFDILFISYQGYNIYREIFPNVFISYFGVYGEDRFSKLGYKWYYSIDWIVSRFKLGAISVNFKSYSNGRNSIGFIFVRGF